MNKAKAFAPASVANVAVGFDLLGFSMGVAGDIVSVEKTSEPTVTIDGITGIVPQITLDAKKNTATAGLLRLIADHKLNFGFKVSIEKGIPLGSGMGGSAASAVGAIVAASALLDAPLTQEQMMSYALIGEAQASGSFHADNVAPCLVGGLTLSRVRGAPTHDQAPHVEVTSLPLPKDLYCVLINPELSIQTKEARGILKTDVPLKTHIEQSANLAGFIAGCFESDFDLIRRSLSDLVIEPQRAHLIPGFYEIQEAALTTGALGCSISGAGPSIFAWVKGKPLAELICATLIAKFRAGGIASKGWAAPLVSDGARVLT